MAQKYGIDDAARTLGISKEALRKRIKRGTVEAYKDGGRWVVELPDADQDADQDAGRDNGYDAGQDAAVIRRLESENEFLRQQVKEQSYIIFNLTKYLGPPETTNETQVKDDNEPPKSNIKTVLKNLFTFRRRQ